MKSRNDFGTYNVVIRNIDRAIKSGRGYSELSSAEQLDELVDRLKDQLESNRERWQAMILKRNSCEHLEFGKATFTSQNRVIGHSLVYERTCKSCGYVELYSVHSEDKDHPPLPDWCKGAQQRYYNNFI